MARILVVDGRADDREVVCAQLQAVGHEIVAATTGEEGLAALRNSSPSLVITDSGLPDMDGLDLVAGIHQAANGSGAAPVVMLSTFAGADSVATARAAGVAEVMFKPCRQDELIARVNSALRSSNGSARQGLLKIGDVELDRVAHKVRVRDTEIDLAPVEYRLLAFLMENPGRVLDRQQLLDKVWNRRSGIGERTVDVHVRRLRAALEPFGCESLLQTVRGFGYRFG
jgi:two-component system phosphate regulon response regulator PhoB